MERKINIFNNEPIGLWFIENTKNTFEKYVYYSKGQLCIFVNLTHILHQWIKIFSASEDLECFFIIPLTVS
jgi:hypothetical protein